MYLISFYVPEAHLQSVKQALFKKGAGKFGKYDSCSWQTMGKGQFRPLTGSNPFSGEHDKVHQVDEYKVEMVCKDEILIDVLKELIKTHPYEKPAYHAIKTITLEQLSDNYEIQ
ncbi:MAG: hypothetical protein U9N77_00955 [Thermodesulfobacteriota bacterium]|nr:hypothetical protein [Thermodesulfobacteriota bacterium]